MSTAGLNGGRKGDVQSRFFGGRGGRLAPAFWVRRISFLPTLVVSAVTYRKRFPQRGVKSEKVIVTTHPEDLCALPRRHFTLIH